MGEQQKEQKKKAQKEQRSTRIAHEMQHQANSRKNIATIMEEQAQRIELYALSMETALLLESGAASTAEQGHILSWACRKLRRQCSWCMSEEKDPPVHTSMSLES